MDDKIPQTERARVDFFKFWNLDYYLDRVKLVTSNFTHSCNMARTTRQRRNWHLRQQGLGYMISLITVAIEGALLH